MSGKFRVVAPLGVIIPEGMVLDLTPDQAKPRTHNLCRVADGYLVEGPVMFKSGEEIGIVEGHLSKMFLGHFAAPDEVVVEHAADEAVPLPVARRKNNKRAGA
jgi:hypothetical protein